MNTCIVSSYIISRIIANAIFASMRSHKQRGVMAVRFFPLPFHKGCPVAGPAHRAPWGQRQVSGASLGGAV